MQFSLKKISYDKITLAKRDAAYIKSDPKLFSFVPFKADIEGLRKKITNRNQFPFFRKEIVQALHAQYSSINHNTLTAKKIDTLLKEQTFTITTAHQPSLFTGPLYFLYKAASCINLANQLQTKFPDYNFVPVFVLGAEDHDFEEINHLHLYNKTVTWDRGSGGPTGMMPIKGITALITQIKEILPQTESANDIIQKLNSAFSENRTYGEAMQVFIHELFGKYGLLVLQMNAPELKRLAIPIFRKEILERPSYSLINQTILALKEKGFKHQAKPRELNLFYMTDASRKRIVFEDDTYQVIDSAMEWTEAELIRELEASPERFSPNVITRPLYQEFILPNIAYVGGGGELAYWQERAQQFEHFGISYPVLIRRNSALWVDAYVQKQLGKLSLSEKDLFEDTQDLILQIDREAPDLSVKNELEQLTEIFNSILQKANQVSPDLKGRILAEKTKQIKSIQQLESKLKKAYKQKNETNIKKIEKLKTKIFPNGGLQERYDNFLPIYAEYGQDYIDFLVARLDPLDKFFLIINPLG